MEMAQEKTADANETSTVRKSIKSNGNYQNFMSCHLLFNEKSLIEIIRNDGNFQ